MLTPTLSHRSSTASAKNSHVALFSTATAPSPEIPKSVATHIAALQKPVGKAGEFFSLREVTTLKDLNVGKMIGASSFRCGIVINYVPAVSIQTFTSYSTYQ
jgi:hypothetical protein